MTPRSRLLSDDSKPTDCIEISVDGFVTDRRSWISQYLARYYVALLRCCFDYFKAVSRIFFASKEIGISAWEFRKNRENSTELVLRNVLYNRSQFLIYWRKNGLIKDRKSTGTICPATISPIVNFTFYLSYRYRIPSQEWKIRKHLANSGLRGSLIQLVRRTAECKLNLNSKECK